MILAFCTVFMVTTSIGLIEKRPKANLIVVIQCVIVLHEFVFLSFEIVRIC